MIADEKVHMQKLRNKIRFLTLSYAFREGEGGAEQLNSNIECQTLPSTSNLKI